MTFHAHGTSGEPSRDGARDAPLPADHDGEPPWRDRLASHNDILDLVVRNASLSDTLQVITAMVEREISGSRASVLLLDSTGQRMHVGAGPSLPSEFNAAIDGELIGPGQGTCGTAAYEKRVVITESIADSPSWDQWRPAAEAAGLAACWSTPFLGQHNRVLGTFAVYFDRPRVPQAAELALLHDAGYLAAVAVQHDEVRQLLHDTNRTDPLTGIPNRVVLAERLTEVEAQAAESGRRFAVVQVSVDGMGPINEALGPTVGDEVLRVVARRLTETVGTAGLATHLWGSDFAVVVGDLRDDEAAVQLAGRLRDAVGEPVEIEGVVLVVGTTLGVATYGGDVLTGPRPADEPLRAANVAAQRAKDSGSQQIGVYDPHADRAADVILLAPELRRGLEREELTLAYQPIVRLSDEQIDRYEALLRWTTPHGAVPPDAFVTAAEQTGMVGDLGRYALRRALAELRRLRDAGSAVGMSVNLSVRQLSDDTLPALVGGLLAEYELPPACVTLEVTEGVVLTSTAKGWGTLAEMRELGVRIALDDFGTGFSQLPYLRSFDFDEIKIDRVYVATMDADIRSRAFIVAAIAFASVAGMTVVAEGIERCEQAEALLELGVGFGQGFLFGAAVTSPSGAGRRPRPGPGGQPRVDH